MSVELAVANAVAGPCSICGRAFGDGLGCQNCGHVRGLPGGVVLASPARRLGENLLELVLVVVTLAIGWIIWAAIVFGRGQTPAKQVLGMKVVSIDQGRPLTWGMMFLRECIVKPLFNVVFSWVLYLPLLWILWDKNKQELWDKAMGTIVVNDYANELGLRSFELQRPVLSGAAVSLTVTGLKTCPDCAESVPAEAKVCKHCSYRFRICPDCAETVMPAAKVCKHCGYRFPEAAASVT